jgi:hypothetical protein
MRVWDCDPVLLTRQHLCGEWNEIHGLWKAVNLRRLGEQGGWTRHPETVRFAQPGGRAFLMVRREFLRAEGTRRDFIFTAEFSPAPEEIGYSDPMPPVPVQLGWTVVARMLNWPWLEDPRANPPTDPFGPWHRDGVSYEHYRLEGPYADGVLTLAP